jgi:O-glycosyl hydrolase
MAKRARPAPVIGILALLGALARAGPASAAANVSIAVDASIEHQTWFGFGATQSTLVYGGAGDVLTASQRQRALDALFNQVKLSTGQAPTTFEAPASSTLASFFGAQANDDSDPLNLDANGFFTGLGDAFKAKVVDLAGSAFDLYPDVKISTRWGSKWLAALESTNYDTFLNECAEQALAGVRYWKTTYGVTPAYAMLFNEPLSGNGELDGGNEAAVVDIVARSGQRLEAAGLGAVKFVVPAEETEDKSLATANAILNDSTARKYVGAIAYHPYPYGSTYSYVPNILATSGAGSPDAGKIQVRRALRDLGAQHGLPVWMTEVSHGFMQGDGVQVTDHRILRGRAIHIHDELVYADAAAYFGMNSLWDSASQASHFGTDGSELMISSHEDIVLVAQASDSVVITATGRAIGHYARFIRRGATRIEATSSDPLVLVTAFRDDTQAGRFVLVVVNNAAEDRTLDVAVSGLALDTAIRSEQSTAAAAWQEREALTPTTAPGFAVTVPPESVTTFATEGGAGAGSGSGGVGGSGGAAGASGSAGGSSSGGSPAASGGTAGSAGGSSTAGGAGGSAGVGPANGTSADTANEDASCGCRFPREPSGSVTAMFAALVAVAFGARTTERTRRRR